jgi:multidrug resistance efflux pump
MRRIGMLLLALLSPLAAAETLQLDGEIAALDSASVAPPSVRGVWNFQITQLAADGSTLQIGQPLVSFDGTDLQRRLVDAQGQLKQKQSEQAKLLLDLAERERTDRLATAEQAANLQKAERKAEQPAELVRSVDYRKLVIEREQAARRNELMQRKEVLARRLRDAERALVASDVARAQADVDELSRALSLLTVPAPRDGIVVVRSNWRGERYEVGSQVFVGQSVAEMPDPGTLVVRATVAERDMLRLAQGMPARIRLQGGAGQRLQGKLGELGRAVRSKSRLAPVPVLDVLVHLDGDTSGLKSGMPVVVEVDVPAIGNGVAP